MARSIKIYKNKDFTCIDITTNGKTEYFSTDKGRDLKVIPGGVMILPDKEEVILNNLKILRSEVDDDYGATTDVEFRNELLNRDFFKKGGGGVLGGDFSENITATLDVGGVKKQDVFTTSDTIESAIKKIIAPYVSPVFTSFSIQAENSVSSAIIGEAIQFQSAIFNYVNGSDNDIPHSVSIEGEAFNVSNIIGKEYVLNPHQTLTKNSPTTLSWRLRGYDKNNNEITSRYDNFTWYNQFLFGANSLGLNSSNFQSILTNLSLKKALNSNTTTVSCSADNENVNNYTYVAFSSNYNDLESIIFNGSAPILGAFTKLGVFNWVNEHGVTIPTTVYRSNSKGAFANNDTLNFS